MYIMEQEELNNMYINNGANTAVKNYEPKKNTATYEGLCHVDLAGHYA